MPLIAINKETGERVDITRISAVDVRLTCQPGTLVCPYCDSAMHVRSGHFRKGGWVHQHFVHQAECASEFDRHPESVEHNIAKAWLRDNIQREYRMFWQDFKVDLEVPIQMGWRARGRIADVLVTFGNGWTEAHEVQLATISVRELEERTEDYERAGVDVTWWFGDQNDTTPIRTWSYQAFGAFNVLQTTISTKSKQYAVPSGNRN